jgi:hypothetical protein
MSQPDSRSQVHVVLRPETALLAMEILGLNPFGLAQGSQRNWEKDWK